MGLLLSLLGLGLSLSPATAQAQQCPVPAVCTPGSAPAANQAFGFGIVQVSLNTFSSSTPASGGYQNYSCQQQTTLAVGQRVTLSVRTSSAGPENVRAYLDYNNDGAFTGPGELVLSSDNQTQHTASFTVPATAVLGQPLRLRIAADFANEALPTACATPLYSQTEDYAVVLTANTNAPVAAFAPDALVTCSGCVQFTDQSQNLPTSWRWDFGDGASSTAQNPRHCYAAPGTYAVTLTATNALGSNTSAPVSVTYNSQVPVAADCTPATTAYCCNYGVVKLELGSINHSSADASAGYQDFTCTQRTELFVNESYPLRITTGGSLAHATQAFLDLNNDGVFTANELILNAPEARNPSATLRVPATGAALDQPLRLRIITDFVGATLSSCGPLLNGQAEDYTVILRRFATAPVVDFSTSYGPASCGNAVQFTDLSRGSATAWRWDFGDGSSSTAQNPTHTYPGPGTYTVSLSATNTLGTSTLTRTGFVTVLPACLNYCLANGSGFTPGSPSGLWITRVAVTTATGGALYSNDSGLEAGGYGNYTARPIPVSQGSTSTIYRVEVTSSVNIQRYVALWVDLNRDGVFGDQELLSSGSAFGGGSSTSTFTATLVLPGNLGTGPLRMRVLNAAIITVTAPNPCVQNQVNAEVEDYTLLARPLSSQPARAGLPGELRLYPTPTPAGTLLRLALPDAPAPGLYSLTVENLLGARLLSATRRLGAASEATLDLSSLSPGVYLLRLRDEQGRETLRRVVRQ
jgi:PKD repeat protein